MPGTLIEEKGKYGIDCSKAIWASDKIHAAYHTHGYSSHIQDRLSLKGFLSRKEVHSYVYSFTLLFSALSCRTRYSALEEGAPSGGSRDSPWRPILARSRLYSCTKRLPRW